MAKFYTILFVGYAIIIIIVMIMLKVGVLTYLNQLTESIIFIILLIEFLVSSLIRWGIRNTKNKVQSHY